jgi:hypothetical protein
MIDRVSAEFVLASAALREELATDPVGANAGGGPALLRKDPLG